ncbi:hypothetical protein ACRB68_38580 [Actinomadura sp. RB68]|uniref:Uncharacterized protein n=1 Tax=Actinomadura macrotermitis TaxID=2585200 RepID=A0A7K0BX73_9ACTN|nr:hypothetical protein [Actinomadura macrotermitis]
MQVFGHPRLTGATRPPETLRPLITLALGGRDGRWARALAVSSPGELGPPHDAGRVGCGREDGSAGFLVPQATIRLRGAKVAEPEREADRTRATRLDRAALPAEALS